MAYGSSLPKGTTLRRDRFHCYICYILPELFREAEPCPKQAKDGQACRFVKGHAGDHKGPKKEKDDELSEGAAKRDGAPKLAAERKRQHPMFEKRHRVGPHR
jgi:hypothetical protein